MAVGMAVDWSMSMSLATKKGGLERKQTKNEVVIAFFNSSETFIRETDSRNQ